jgi:dihydroorotate dehydrogenase electron transfer subunit
MPATFRPSFQLPIPYNGAFRKRVQGIFTDICENLAKLARVQTAQSLARVVDARVVARREPAAGVVVLEVRAPAIAAAAGPGQFVMAVPPSAGATSVALGVHDVAEDCLSLLFVVVGSRTRRLAALHPGETLSLFGPLGNGFDLSAGANDVAIVAGGVGIASVLLAARALLCRGSRVRLFYGAATAAKLVDRERFAAAGCEVVVATDDGSEGTDGFVTDALACAAPADLILACGPTAMLRATAHAARTMRVPAQLCLEETFGCGVGACWGCVVPVASENGVAYARVCREGPVFLAEELRW